MRTRLSRRCAGVDNKTARELALQRPLVMHVPDALFPTDNEWDIPVLDAQMQAEFVVLPFTKWGDIARSSRMLGTYHFYTDDYKFNAVWARPLPVVNSGCANAVEPNFSTNDHMPTAAGVWCIYRKRWLARFWQHYGVRVFVDLNVSRKFHDLNLLGVPRGWRAYCTRARMRAQASTDEIMADYETACQHAESEPLFVVYGGQRETEVLCHKIGAVWCPDLMYVKDGRLDDG